MATGMELPTSVEVGGGAYQTEIVLGEDDIHRRVDEMGQGLAEHYAERGEVHALTVMNGALHFASDLRRSMQAAAPGLKVTSDQFRLASYSGHRSSGVLRPYGDFPDIGGRHVLVVEDVVDTGLTLKWLLSALKVGKPASVEVAVALAKDNPARHVDLLGQVAMHVGFEIPNDFVVGYGLDIDERFRDLGGVYRLISTSPPNS